MNLVVILVEVIYLIWCLIFICTVISAGSVGNMNLDSYVHFVSAIDDITTGNSVFLNTGWTEN